jgi:lactoylglutathione lyase
MRGGTVKRVPVVAVYVTDIQKAKTFYCDVLGFKEKAWYGDCILTLQNEGAMMVLEQIEDGTEPRIVPSIEVEDVDAECHRMKAPVPFPVGRLITIFDPNGNEFDVVQYDR